MKIPKPPYTYTSIEYARSVVLISGYEKHGEKYILPYLIYFSPSNLIKLRIRDLDDTHLINNINHYKKNTDDESKAYCEIFTDVLVKRRTIKIQKIKDKIKKQIK